MTPPLAIYYFPLAHVELGALQQLAAERLPAAEQTVAARYRQVAGRCQYLAGRLLLRSLLADRLGGAPVSFELTYGSHGKPALMGGPAFNLTHTQHWVALALGGDAEVGVDIEAAERNLDPNGLASAVLHPEEFSLFHDLAPEQQLDYFLALWSAKEAYLKALGRGLAYGLTRLWVDLPAQRVISPEGVTPLLSITPPPRHAGALVCLGEVSAPLAQYLVTDLATPAAAIAWER